MRIKYSILFVILSLMQAMSGVVKAQPPQAINYQGVARNTEGIPYVSQPIGMRISILQGGEDGNAVYVETHKVVSGQTGLFNFKIGEGAVVSGNFSSIDWGKGSYFLQVEMDVSGGNNYIMMSATELVSVPYALFAEKAGNTGQLSTTTDSNTVIEKGKLGIGIANPEGVLDIRKPEGTMISGDVPIIRMRSPDDSVNFSIWLTSADGNGIGGVQGGKVIFETNHMPGLTINNGMIGIGTIHPSASLDIVDDKGAPALVLKGNNKAGHYASLYFRSNEKVEKKWEIGYRYNRTQKYDLGFGFHNGIDWQPVLQLSPDGKVGVGTQVPFARLHVRSGDVYIEDLERGVILTSPNGSCWRLQVNDDGTLKTTAVECPSLQDAMKIKDELIRVTEEQESK